VTRIARDHQQSPRRSVLLDVASGATVDECVRATCVQGGQDTFGDDEEDTMNRLRRTGALVLVAVISVVGGAVVGASPAHAALPTCNMVMKQGERLIPDFDDGIGYTFNCVLAVGIANDPVYYLQRALNICHGAQLDTDGKFGPKTKAALAKVQHAAGIRADGVYGPKTSWILWWPWWTGDPAWLCDGRIY
jgi:Putative peptidoglycan binding domain